MTDLATLPPSGALQAQQKRVRRRAPVDWTGFAFLIGLAVVILLPLVVTAVWAFAEVWRFPAILPQRVGLGYWQETLSRQDVWQALWLSLRITTTVTVISAVICFPAAYAFARLDFPGRNMLFLAFLSVQAFPKFGLIIATATIFLTLNLIGTFWGVVLIQLVGTLLYMIWIPVSAFQGVDRRLEEAARDVGAGPMRVFWSITLPQALPTLAAAILITFVNTFYETDAAWLIGLPNVRTMPMVMIAFINNALEVQYGAVLFVFLWVPSFLLMLAARRVMGADAFAKGLGG
ncbi:ABC transporter permease [Pleomorphomonas diazotrophica]|uniref:ABC transporter permease n=1 Tax=Pleomorphomonas diazotrophica TaxID=1166257 RepID=A0A1I4UHC5_9HYPH|nr:ABC transporter permease subunit [Pleomorphomonas diazotrophica]PKR89180.1 ABC transporter permease [Pleomorphomonas diazotrophica]SFM88407.1 putative spermidine/putrescine transport system permease protein [Pleomorphomonas diazotrophica]